MEKLYLGLQKKKSKKLAEVTQKRSSLKTAEYLYWAYNTGKINFGFFLEKFLWYNWRDQWLELWSKSFVLIQVKGYGAKAERCTGKGRQFRKIEE